MLITGLKNLNIKFLFNQDSSVKLVLNQNLFINVLLNSKNKILMSFLLSKLMDYGILKYCTSRKSLIFSKNFISSSFINRCRCNSDFTLTMCYVLLIILKITNIKVINWDENVHQLNGLVLLKNYEQNRIIKNNKTNCITFNNSDTIDSKLQNNGSIVHSLLEINKRGNIYTKIIQNIEKDYTTEKNIFSKVHKKHKRKKDINTEEGEYRFTAKKRKLSKKNFNKKNFNQNIIEKAKPTKQKLKSIKLSKQVMNVTSKLSKKKIKKFKKKYNKNLKKGRPILLSDLIQYEELQPLIVQAEVLDYNKCIIMKN